MFSLKALLRYHELAHDGLRRLVKHLQSMPDASLSSPLEGFAFPTIRLQLLHMLDVEAFWVQSMQGLGNEHDWEHEGMLMTGRELSGYQLQVREASIAWLLTETDESLNSTREVNDKGWVNSGLPAEMLLHLMTHAFHHKGQVVAMCRLLGHPAPLTDMIWNPLQLGDGVKR